MGTEWKTAMQHCINYAEPKQLEISKMPAISYTVRKCPWQTTLTPEQFKVAFEGVYLNKENSHNALDGHKKFVKFHQ